MPDTPRRGPEVVRLHPGTAVEAWHFWPNEPDDSCQWPTADLAAGLLEGKIDDPNGYGVRAVLYAYVDLLTHPAGTESRVEMLRALRRAEKGWTVADHTCPACRVPWPDHAGTETVCRALAEARHSRHAGILVRYDALRAEDAPRWTVAAHGERGDGHTPAEAVAGILRAFAGLDRERDRLLGEVVEARAEVARLRAQVDDLRAQGVDVWGESAHGEDLDRG